MIPIPSAHGQAVRRVLPVEPDKENLGVVLNGVYQVLEHRRYSPEQGGDRLILGPIWPEKPDKVIMGQWSVAAFVYEASKQPLVPVAADPMPTPQPPLPSAPEPAPAPAEAFPAGTAQVPGKKRRRRGRNRASAQVEQAVASVLDEQNDAEIRAAYNLPVKPANGVGAFATQVGGDHYKGLPDGYQPTQIAVACNLDFMQFNIVKYAMRHKHKGGADDLKKAIHYCQMALQTHYPNE